MESFAGWQQVLILAFYIGLYFAAKKFVAKRFNKVNK